MSATAEHFVALFGFIEKLKAHNRKLIAATPPTHTPKDAMRDEETAKLHTETDAAMEAAREHLEIADRPPPPAPPIDNAHVAEGCELFTSAPVTIPIQAGEQPVTIQPQNEPDYAPPIVTIAGSGGTGSTVNENTLPQQPA